MTLRLIDTRDRYQDDTVVPANYHTDILCANETHCDYLDGIARGLGYVTEMIDQRPLAAKLATNPLTLSDM